MMRTADVFTGVSSSQRGQALDHGEDRNSESGTSDDFKNIHGPLVTHVACVQSAGRVEEQDVDLFVGHGAVLDASGRDEELALFERDFPVPRFRAEPTLHDQEQLVLVIVPDELPFELDQLDVLAVQLADELGLQWSSKTASFSVLFTLCILPNPRVRARLIAPGTGARVP